MKNKLLLPIFITITLITSCKKFDEVNLFRSSVVAKDTIVTSELNENSFNKTDFKDRAEELIYIREYLNYKLALILIKKKPAEMKKAQYELISNGENPTLIEATKRTISFSIKYEIYMNVIIEDDLSIKDVKSQLESTGELNYKTTETNSDLIKNEVNLIGNKIYGDFNGDGTFEYAFRVLTKKGNDNPVDGGVPDEYEVHFSDNNIKPIIGSFYWFILINEGDLDNDGSDEISVRQDPMNGCFGYVSTFTIKNNEVYEIINIFSFYSGSCDNSMSIDPQDLVEKDNGIVYYYDYDPNFEFTVNKSKKKIRGKKVKAFDINPT